MSSRCPRPGCGGHLYNDDGDVKCFSCGRTPGDAMRPIGVAMCRLGLHEMVPANTAIHRNGERMIVRCVACERIRKAQRAAYAGRNLSHPVPEGSPARQWGLRPYDPTQMRVE
jgi:hypothetical protein